ncbi:MAG: HAD family phosphatase [Desulfobacteraceae bacterium]|nr:HAD family phosphatase [Desulfobacteraceae bacterium]
MMTADRLYIPANTKAILWDMDGVLLDTLGLDMTIFNELLHQYFGNHVNLTKEFIRSVFAYHSPESWKLIFEFIKNEYNISGTENDYNQILKTYDQARNNHIFEINPGIIEILESAMKTPLKLAVVSNNLTADVKTILSKSGIPMDVFDLIVGNDIKDLKKKPAPDTYLFATEILKVNPGQCVVVEDSLEGAEAGKQAGCFTVGVATGGTDFKSLEKSQFTDRVYSSFHLTRLSIQEK